MPNTEPRCVAPTMLSPSKIREVCRRLAAGCERKTIAKAFGISCQTLYSYAGDIAATHPYRYQSTPKLTPQDADELRRRVTAGEVRREVAGLRHQHQHALSAPAASSAAETSVWAYFRHTYFLKPAWTLTIVLHRTRLSIDWS
jgi:Helix-turn-helix domain of resolvase